MTREELQQDFHDEQGINWLNSQEEPDIDYVMWLEDKILAIKNNASLPPAEGAEERIRVRNILQDFYRRGEYELEQAEEDIMRLFQPQPTAEGAEKPNAMKFLSDNGYGSGFNYTTKQVANLMQEFAAQQQPTAEGAEEILEDIAMRIDASGVGNNRDAIKRFYRDKLNTLATLHAQRIADKMVSERDELQVLMNDISEWSDKAFGDGQQNPAIVYHLKKEVNELIEAIEKTNALGSDPSVGVGEFGRQRTVTRVEYADCLMLLLDSAHHFGISAGDLLSVTRGKLEINKVRRWGKPDENGVVEHIEP